MKFDRVQTELSAQDVRKYFEDQSAISRKAVDMIGGTEIHSDEYVAGGTLFTIDAEGNKVPVPKGRYETQGGYIITVDDKARIIEKSAK